MSKIKMERSSLEQLELAYSHFNDHLVESHSKKISFGAKTNSSLEAIELHSLINERRTHSRQHLPKKRFKLPPPLRFADENPTFRNRVLIFSGVALLASVPIFLVKTILLSRIQRAGNLPYPDCTFSGNFTFQGIDLPFGEMTFAQAKAIDLVWNTVVGRGVQMLLSLASYHVLLNTLVRLAEEFRVTYELYSVLAFSPITLQSAWVLGKTLFSKLALRAKLSLGWLLISTVYLLSFPTLIDAVSGYQAMQSTVLELTNNQTVDLSKGLVAAFTAQNSFGSRELPRLPDAPLGSLKWLDSLGGFFQVSVDLVSISFTAQISTCNAEWNECLNSQPNPAFTICDNSSTSTLYYSNETNASYEEDPAWTFLIYNDTKCDLLYSMLQSWEWRYPDPSKMDWDIELLSSQDKYQCIARHLYQWGFSYAWLLLVACINAVWVMGTYFVWLDAERHSELIKKGREGGLWRALLDLADAAVHDLGPNICAYTDLEITDALLKQTGLRYRAKINQDGTANFGLRSSKSTAIANEKFVLNWETDYGG